MKSEKEQNNSELSPDERVFDEALKKMAASVTGAAFKTAFADDEQNFIHAVRQSLKKYHISLNEGESCTDDLNSYLNKVLTPHGIMYRAIELDENWYRYAYGTMLGTLKESKKTVSLSQNWLGRYYYVDPDSGKRVMLGRASAELLEKEAILFYEPLPLRKIGIGDLVNFMKRNMCLWDVIGILLVFLVIMELGLALPNLNSLLYSRVANSKDYSMLVTIGVFLVSLAVSSSLFQVIKRILLFRMKIKIGNAVNAATFMRILSMPASFFREFSTGELFTYANAVHDTCDKLIDSVFSTGITALLSLFYISAIFVFARALVAPALITIGISVAFMLVSAMMRKKQVEKRMKAMAASSGESFAIISGVRKIRLTGAEKRAFARWAGGYAKQASLAYDPPLFLAINPAINTLISLSGMIAMYYLAIKSGISVGQYQAFNVSYGMVSGAFFSLAGVALTAAEIRPLLNLAKPLMDAEPEVTSDGEQIEAIGEVEVSNITFSYNENQKPVINDLSFKLKPGEYVALVGKTGCGKSTIVRLLLGFEKAQKGSVYYDHKDISSLDLSSLRKRIGTVTQNGKLISGTIFSNIIISAPWLTMDDAWEAAEIAGIADDIRSMPMGMFTLISEGNGGISGGQRQRLMIARAIAHKPDLLIFDEATSALDNEVQEKVTQALNELKCTRLVIAHRLSTIKKCDRIMLLEEGTVRESGTYDELMSRDGAFKRLVERQQVT